MSSSSAKGTSRLPEFTLRAVLCGLAFGVLFGASNAYLGLKAGLTVSTSIPIAVLSAAIFRLLSRGGGSVLEMNMAQTIGSASSSLASGTIFTIPALFLWGMPPTTVQVALLAFFGGLLGILAMVPLRRLLLVQADAELPYPEGRACAEVIRATERGGASGRYIFLGLGLGLAVKIVVSALHWIPDEIALRLGFLPNGSLAVKVAPALIAVGFIVGYRAASVMVGGGLLASLVLYPLITKIYLEGSKAAGAASPLSLTGTQVREKFLLFVGMGAVAAAGLVTVIRTTPTMVKSLAAVLHGMKRSASQGADDRTDRDLPGPVLLGGLAFLVLCLAFIPGLFAGNLSLTGRIVAAIAVTLFGFLFVPVSSRLVGLIGVSSNPTSAMALITLASTAAVFFLLDWKGPEAMAAVLTVGTVVCVAASKAGDISQDLKTGMLVGATPILQQFGQILAASVACFAVAGVVLAIGHGEGFGKDGMPAPQATLMKTVVEAVLGASLPWDLMVMGGTVSIVGMLAGLPALPLALGIYLPLSTMAAVFVGGIVRRVVEGGASPSETLARRLEAPILCASGYVAGEGLAGVLIAGYVFVRKLGKYSPPEPSLAQGLLGLFVVLFAAFVLCQVGRKRSLP